MENPISPWGIAARCYAAPWRDSVEFLLRNKNDLGIQIGAPITWVAAEPYKKAEPTFRLDFNAAQLLMDDLWQAGLRPTEGTGSAGALRAVEKHLEDMRTLVFKPTSAAAG